MELKKQRHATTLARRLGEPTHFSPLLRKVSQASGCSDDRLAQWLLKCAVQRGASHYRREFDPTLPPDNPALSNQELGIALCLGNHAFEPMLIRAAAQLLSSARTDARELARLAILERCAPVLRHIAEAAARIAPAQEPWRTLRTLLPQRRAVTTDALPHWSRFVSQTGYTPAGRGQHIEWLTCHE